LVLEFDWSLQEAEETVGFEGVTNIPQRRRRTIWGPITKNKKQNKKGVEFEEVVAGF
jgi:hypothetical protein